MMENAGRARHWFSSRLWGMASHYSPGLTSRAGVPSSALVKTVFQSRLHHHRPQEALAHFEVPEGRLSHRFFFLVLGFGFLTTFFLGG